jgi:hypothetical protein
MNDEVITAPKPEPFALWPVCRACGYKGRGVQTLWGLMCRGTHFRHMNIRFCPGGKPPTEQHEHQHPLAGVAPFDPIKHEVRYDCAGVDSPHLHLGCLMCGMSWLMETKGPIERRL